MATLTQPGHEGRAYPLTAHLIHLAGRPAVSLYGEVPVSGPVCRPVSRLHLDTGSEPLGLVEPEEDDPLERSADAAVWTVEDAEHEPVGAIGEPVEVPERILSAVAAGTLTYTAAAREAGCSVRTIRRRLGAAEAARRSPVPACARATAAT